MEGKVYVVGIGADALHGLTARAREVLEDAQLLVGTQRLLEMIPESEAERLAGNPGTAEVLARIEEEMGRRRVVVLASGDPGFFGIGKLLTRRFGKERVEIVPHLSSVQLAFARIKESWENATFFSVHGRSMEGIVPAIRGSRKVAILTDGRNTPAAIARLLLAARVDGYRAFLCEDLGGEGERVRETDLSGLEEMESSSLAVLILLREGQDGPEPRHGIPDEEFYQRRPDRGLITKMEVRMASLARLDLRDSSVVWDVGAGSGSVAIEAAMIARRGQVYAIERDPEGADLILKNRAKFGVSNLFLVSGEAPAALDALPSPDAIFVGGSGGLLSGILDVAARSLRPWGRVVVNAATLETAGAAMAGLRERGFQADVTLVQVSRGKDVAGLTRFEALNPVFIVTGLRTGD